MTFDELLEQVLEYSSAAAGCRIGPSIGSSTSLTPTSLISRPKLSMSTGSPWTRTAPCWSGLVESVMAPATDQVRGPVSTAVPHQGGIHCMGIEQGPTGEHAYGTTHCAG